MDRMKQAIIVRTDLKMGKGKIAGQVAHASLRAFWEAEKQSKEKTNTWIIWSNEIKIVLKVHSEKELIVLMKKCEDAGVPWAIVNDMGLTQLEPNTLTALGIGPAEYEKVDEITKGLKLL